MHEIKRQKPTNVDLVELQLLEHAKTLRQLMDIASIDCVYRVDAGALGEAAVMAETYFDLLRRWGEVQEQIATHRNQSGCA